MSNFNVVAFVQAVENAREHKRSNEATGKAAPVKYLTAAQLVQRWDGSIQKGTLANWRSKGKGPSYVKMGSKVLYPVAKVEEWEDRRLKELNDNNPNTEAI